MRIFILTLCVFSSLSLTVSAATYKVAAYAWEPFIDAKREDGGVSMEVLRKALATQGHDIELVSMPWSRSLAMLEKNKVDILPAVWFTEERTHTMKYSDSYAANRLVFIKSKDSNYEFKGLNSLHDQVVAIVRNYAYDEAFLSDSNITFSVADSLVSNVKKVINKRVDLTIDDEIAAKAIIPQPLLEKIEFTTNALSESPLYVTCNKSNPKCETIITSFNQGLAILKANGTLDTLLSAN